MSADITLTKTEEIEVLKRLPLPVSRRWYVVLFVLLAPACLRCDRCIRLRPDACS